VRNLQGEKAKPVEAIRRQRTAVRTFCAGGHIGGVQILILGGTVFVGRALARQAIARGHTVTLLNRGLSGEPIDRAEVVHGDRSRADTFDELEGRAFDAVIDTSRQRVRHVRRATAALSWRSSRYVFVSTVSVYIDLAVAGIDETAPTAAPLIDPTYEQEDDPLNYPALNTACEQIVRDAYPDTHLILRPCLIVGDRDPTDRFGYWLDRLSREGEILVPGRPQRTVQFIDVNDLAAFTLHALETGTAGTFNVRGPSGLLSMSDFIDACVTVTGSKPARLTWVPDDFLLGAGLEPYTDLPLWIPETPDLAGFDRIDARKAVEAGLACRPLRQTLSDALSWEAALGLGRTRSAGLSPRREAEVLHRWHEREERLHGAV
jgi:2'-hydroxyisoflavone reductase